MILTCISKRLEILYLFLLFLVFFMPLCMEDSVSHRSPLRGALCVTSTLTTDFLSFGLSEKSLIFSFLKNNFTE